MSAELPQLERLIADAAERHYGGRAARRWRPRLRGLAVIAFAAAGAAAVVFALMQIPQGGSDDRSAAPPGEPAAQLAKRYSVFAGSQTPTNFEARALSDMGAIIDQRRSPTTRLLRRFATGGGVVAAAGTSAGRPAVCVSVKRPQVGGSSCGPIAAAVSSRGPYFVFGGIGRYPNEVIALVPDDVTSVEIQVKGGITRKLSLENNFAYRAGGRPICWVRWTTADGQTGEERGATRAQEAMPDDPNPDTCV